MNRMKQGNEVGRADLEARVRRDLDELCRPPNNWVVPRQVKGEPVLDVMIIGGGMCGMLVWFALQSAGIRNVRIVDQESGGYRRPLDDLCAHGDAAFAQAPDRALPTAWDR